MRVKPFSASPPPAVVTVQDTAPEVFGSVLYFLYTGVRPGPPRLPQRGEGGAGRDLDQPPPRKVACLLDSIFGRRCQEGE